MRQVAANIIVKDINTRYINHVIEIDNGCIVGDCALQGEKEAIEWIGGMIICSPYKTIAHLDEIRISDFIAKYSSPKYAKNLYAWHISGIDISKDSIITDRNISLIQ